jgi:glucose dehydrogenase
MHTGLAPGRRYATEPECGDGATHLGLRKGRAFSEYAAVVLAGIVVALWLVSPYWFNVLHLDVYILIGIAVIAVTIAPARFAMPHLRPARGSRCSSNSPTARRGAGVAAVRQAVADAGGKLETTRR